ncbi:MAG TPA: PQQ-binding-like beta-propeller repeat protein [Trebonia sp.]|nr:PQQ-binding-like beta-propeller repeat protein [Trebonia sp.]
MRPVAGGAALAAAACVAAACSGPHGTADGASTTAPVSVPGPGATASASGANWPEYDGNPARTGVAAGVPAAGALATAWIAHLDGAVYGQPLIVGKEVIAATENDSVYALNRSTGKVLWRTHLGTPVPRQDLNGCGNIFPLGITGTPVYDAGNGLVYAVAEVTGYHHVLVALDAATGAVKLRRSLDNPTSANQPAYNQQRPALAIADGRVYAAFGGLSGDCGPYQGSVVSAPLTGNGPLTGWRTPASREGAIWAPGGPVTGPGGNLWISIGNGAATSGAYDGSDSVTELSPSLRRLAYFAPSTWAADNSRDLDLGSTQPALAAGGTVFIMGKRGVGYLLSATHLGGVGGQLAEQSICQAFGTAAVSGPVVYEPCRHGGGMAAVQVSAAKKTIKVLWRGPAGAQGTPVIGGGAVWVTDYSGRDGILYELNRATGAVRHQITIGQGLPHFSSLSLSGGTAYVNTLTGVTAINGA